MRKIIADIQYTLVQFSRSRQSIFFAFLFPLLFLVLAWYLFGSPAPVALYCVDNDGSSTSRAILESLNSTGTFTRADSSGLDLAQMLRDGRISAYLEIPRGFEKGMAEASSGNGTVSLKLYYDRSNAAAPSVLSVVQETVDRLNLDVAGSKEPVLLNSHEVSTHGRGYLNFLFPGILGIAVMGSALDLTVGFIANYRATGVLRKLAVTPLSRIEWNLSRVLSGMIVALASVIVSIVIAWFAFGIHPVVNLLSLLLVLAGSIMFVGLGIVIANVLKDGDVASAASFTITLPLILVSGSLFPVTQLPWFLQAIAIISPLTYLNDGLRSAIVTGNTGNAVTDLAIVAALGIVLFCIGVISSRWGDV